VHQSHDVRGSARGRLRVAFDQTLLYATGSVALANFFPFALDESFNQARPGWTAGGGVEYAIADNWSGWIEYRHSDFGSTPYESSNFDGNSYRIRVKDAVRVGVAYHFDFAEPKPSPRDADALR
jgi:outer membrane immunogenic protein